MHLNTTVSLQPNHLKFSQQSKYLIHERSLTMKLNKNIGMLLAGIWFVLTGLIPLLRLSFSGLGTLMAVLAIAAGALIVAGK